MNLICIQYPISMGNTAKNKQLFLDEINLQTNTQEGVIVLPEMWYAGFDYSNIKNLAKQTESLCIDIQKNINNDSIIISSMPELDHDKIFNTIFAISKKTIIAKYRKNILFSPTKEDQYFANGNNTTIFEYKGIKIGMHTCYEIRFPELFRITAFLGADLIVVPGIWPANKIDHWLTLLKARAIENQCFIAGCDTSMMHTHKKIIPCGYSVIFDPWGKELASAKDQDTVIKSKIDIAIIKEVRNIIPSFDKAISLFKINRKSN